MTVIRIHQPLIHFGTDFSLNWYFLKDTLISKINILVSHLHTKLKLIHILRNHGSTINFKKYCIPMKKCNA